MLSALYFVVFIFYLSINGGTCTETGWVSLNPNDIERRLEKLESSLTRAQERISTLEGKANNSTQHMVGFTACHSKGSTFAAHQTIIYDHIITNIGNAYDVRDGEFNVPYDGLYTFTVTGMAYSNTEMYFTLLKNGVYVQKMYSNLDTSDTSAFTTNLYLQAGDAIWVVNGGHDSGHLHPNNYNCFSGMLAKEKY